MIVSADQMSLGSFLSGVLGGLIPLVIWEGSLKPRRERRALATILSEEISRNTRRAVRLRDEPPADSHSLRRDPYFSSMIFDAVVGRVGEFPAYDVGRIVELYRWFKDLNAITERITAAREAFSPNDSEGEVITRWRKGEGVEHVLEQMPQLIEMGYEVLDSLAKSGAPGWTRRRVRSATKPGTDTVT